MELKLLNQPLDVEAVRLTAPPKGADRLATSGRLLVAWRLYNYVLDHESGKRYHLGFYHPEFGWRACRWDEKHEEPFYVLPTSESTIWVSTYLGELIYISVGDEIRATMLASVVKKSLSSLRILPSLRILHADIDSLWIQERVHDNIMQLRLQKKGLTIVNKRPSSYVYWMYPREDGTCVVVGTRQIYVFQSPLLEELIYYEDNGRFFCDPPFLVRKDEDFYYTKDPRCGWKKMPISVENESDAILFFAQYNDIYFAAVYRDQEKKTQLYRFSGESETDAEYMWEISGFLPDQFAMYNGLVCVAENKPLVISGREGVPENHGFLVWDSRLKTFHKDIPQLSIMHARHIIPSKLKIPEAWSDKDKGNMYGMFDK